MIEVTDATLTKLQKNRILQVILEYGPPPGDFQWTEREQKEHYLASLRPYIVSVLTHHPTGYFCIFGAHEITVSPGISKKIQDVFHEDDWRKKENACGKWLVLVKSEVDAPDLWATIGQEKALSTAASSPDLDNRPFTAAEQNLIATKLDEIKAYLLEGQQFAAEQAEFVKERFEYFEESSKRMGRKDWLNVLYGGLITLVVGVALAPDAAKDLLRLAATAFQSLWGTAQGLLQ
jgi:hypothetical protein